MGNVSKRLNWPVRVLNSLALSITALSPFFSAHAAPGGLYASTPDNKCRQDMIYLSKDYNNDGTKDFLCGNGPTTRELVLISGDRGGNSILAALATFNYESNGDTSSNGARVAELKDGNLTRFASCASSSSGRTSVFPPLSASLLFGTPVNVNPGAGCTGLQGVDINQDGRDEVLVSSRTGNFVKAYSISATTPTTLTQLFSFTPATNLQGDFGHTIIRLGDLDGDGQENWAISAPLVDVGGKADRGAVVIYNGNPNSTVTPVATLLGTNAGDRLGTALSYTDLNDDGQKELLVGAAGGSYVRVFAVPSFSEIRDITRNSGDGLGSFISPQAEDVNGDNIRDLAIVHSNGTAIISGADDSVLKNYANMTSQPHLLGKVSEYDADQVFSAVFVGEGLQSQRWDLFEGDQYNCPVLTTSPPLTTVSIFGNAGSIPSMRVQKGCAVQGGQLKVELNNLTPLTPFIALAAPEINATPVPIANTANRLVPDRSQIDMLEVGLASSSGNANVFLRDLNFTDSNGDGIFEWIMQTIQLGQFAPTAHPLGGGISSGEGYMVIGQ